MGTSGSHPRKEGLTPQPWGSPGLSSSPKGLCRPLKLQSDLLDTKARVLLADKGETASLSPMTFPLPCVTFWLPGASDFEKQTLAVLFCCRLLHEQHGPRQLPWAHAEEMGQSWEPSADDHVGAPGFLGSPWLSHLAGGWDLFREPPRAPAHTMHVARVCEGPRLGLLSTPSAYPTKMHRAGLRVSVRQTLAKCWLSAHKLLTSTGCGERPWVGEAGGVGVLVGKEGLCS